MCDISSIEVPVLFYDGDESKLPDIYDQINSTGTKLIKCEIFAASWITQNIEIQNEKVTEAIRKRYSTIMSKRKISISRIKADGNPELYSLLDYLFGLGKLLANEFLILFGINDDPTQMESVAFA